MTAPDIRNRVFASHNTVVQTSAQKESKADIQFGIYVEKVWLPKIRANVEESTYAEYQHEVDVIAKYFCKTGVTLGALVAEDIEDFYEHLANERGLNGCTLQKYHSRITSACKYAARKLKWISFSPASDVDQPKKQDFIASYYNQHETKKLLDFVQGHKLELAVMLGIYGLRRSEVVGLKWEFVDFQNNTISIFNTVTQYTLDGVRHIKSKSRAKTKKSRRTLPIIPALRNKLLQMKQEQEECRRLCGRSYTTDYLAYVYVDEMGDRIKPDYITGTFRRFLEQKGLRLVRYHELRHSCASLLLANGVPLKQIQEWLGHSDFAITANTYAHLEFSSKLKSAEAMAWIDETTLALATEANGADSVENG